MMQSTLSKSVDISGIGLHSGLAVKMILKPARVDHGIRFLRTDIIGATADILATVESVTSLDRATTLSNKLGHSVATVEHLLAACQGVGLDNVLIEIDGPEVPIMDGSSLDFCNIFKEIGIVGQSKARNLIRILQPVSVTRGASSATLVPSTDNVLSLAARIDFEDNAIGAQQASLRMTSGAFCKELSYARTFGRSGELAGLHKQGLALGGSLDNAILVDGDRIVNPDGLRCTDEFVRHKLLDAIGDLALAGAMIAGHYEAEQPGHRLNIMLLQKLFATPDAWCWDSMAEGDEAVQLAPVLADPDTLHSGVAARA